MKYPKFVLLPRFQVALLVAAAVAGQASAADEKPSIIVAKTQSSVSTFQASWGEGLANMFIESLTQIGKWKVLESVALDDLRDEQALVGNGEVSQEQGVKKGGWAAADYALITKVVRFGGNKSGFGVSTPDPWAGGGGLPPRRSSAPSRSGPAPRPGPRGQFRPPVPFAPSDFSMKTETYEVEIAWRITDIASREIVKSGKGVGKFKSSSFKIAGMGSGGFSMNNEEFANSGYGKATAMAVAEITSQLRQAELAPGARVKMIAQQTEQRAQEAVQRNSTLRNVKGAVELVDGNEVWVNLGANNGFEKGNTIKLYRPIEKKNSQGKVITTTYEPVGEIRLEKVKADKSMGVYSGAAKIQEGWAAADASVDIEKMD